MTFLAGQPRVLPFQVVTRQAVVKLLLRPLPMQKIKVFAVMLEMATNAILAIGISHLNLSVIAMLRRQPLCHFLMTIETPESGRAGSELMAARTLCGSG